MKGFWPWSLSVESTLYSETLRDYRLRTIYSIYMLSAVMRGSCFADNVEQLQKVGLASLLIPNAINFQGAFDSLQDRQSPGAAGKDGV